MSEGTLSAALEAEHREIDAGIAEYAQSAEAGTPNIEPVLRAIASLRRHIYLEEEMVFPALREAGLMAPVFVMVREHGEIWRAMDGLEKAVATDPVGRAAAEVCGELVKVIEAHNMKEEMILYPQTDTIVTSDARTALDDFLATGKMPDGWTCQAA